VGDLVFDEGGLGEGSRPRGLHAAAVVHVDVDDHASVLHLRDGLPVYEGGGAGADDVDRADEKVATQNGVADAEVARRQRRNAGDAHVLEAPEALEVSVYHDDRRPEAARQPRSAGPYDAATQDHHAARPHARRASEQDAASPERSLQVVRPDLGRQASRYLAHRREHRQAAAFVAYGLHREGHAPGVKQGAHEARIDRQREEGQQHHALPQVAVLLFNRPVDFDDDLRLGVDVCCLRDHVCPGLLVAVVGDARRHPRSGLDQHPVASSGELVRGVGGQRHPGLAGRSLPRHADPHLLPPKSVAATGTSNAVLSCA
jgi:hypothetical protein